MNDPTEDVLAGSAPTLPSNEFRQTLLRRTRAVVKRRRIIRRIGFMGLLVAFYTAGALTMSWVNTRASPDPPMAKSESTAPAPEPAVAEANPSSPLAMEWQAIDTTQGRADLFRQAGDRYLTEFGDVESALRCYRNALDVGSAADAAIRLDDSWLMISLKQAKQKEKHNDSLDS